jgi:hypothetical protein
VRAAGEKAYRLFLESTETLKDLGTDRSPCCDIPSLCFWVERYIVRENIESESMPNIPRSFSHRKIED